MEPTEADIHWPTQFREAEKNYAKFYVSPIESLGVFCLYAGRDNELESVHRGRIDLQVPGTMTCSEVKQLAAKCSQLGRATYRLTRAGVFCVGIGPEDMIQFVSTDWEPNAWADIDVSSGAHITLPDSVHALGKEAAIVLVFRARALDSRKTARRTPGLTRMRATRRNRPRKGLKAVKREDST
tara:strand:+ start:75 stop:623 length:549 start_codon:yes stop_codon:yes gene_type:complete